MALRQIIETEGRSVVHTPLGAIENGIQRISYSAYIKVVEIRGDKSNVIASVNFANEKTQTTKQYSVPVSTESGASNFIAQVYEHLKTLPEFANATDC
jgi:hypothetical protein